MTTLRTACICGFVLLCHLFFVPTVQGNPLENYVKQPEPEFRWQLNQRVHAPWGTVAYYELVSQNWRGLRWTHHLALVRPKAVRNPDVAFLKIAGDGEPGNRLDDLRLLAERGGAVAAVITNVPNQPFFEERREDALIAYTLNQYMKTGDESWPLLFPMVKSAVKAMDAVQAIAKEAHGQTIERFVVGGASKRGWTTWLAAAVDPRVAAIAPMVIDTLNMKAQLQWAEQIYGKQSIKLKDYTELNLHRKVDNAAMQKLRSWIDPYAYVDRYTMPKLLLLGTNDPYWTVDSLRHYWNDLPEPKLIFQTPNAGHDLNGGSEALQTLAAFFELVADRKALPKLTWRFQASASGQIEARVDSPLNAEAIRLWSARSPDRDFRDDRWTSQNLYIARGSSHAKTRIPPPASGYRAYLMEVDLKTDTGHPFKLSTEAQVVPDTLPCRCWAKE